MWPESYRSHPAVVGHSLARAFFPYFIGRAITGHSGRITGHGGRITGHSKNKPKINDKINASDAPARDYWSHPGVVGHSSVRVFPDIP